MQPKIGLLLVATLGFTGCRDRPAPAPEQSQGAPNAPVNPGGGQGKEGDALNPYRPWSQFPGLDDSFNGRRDAVIREQAASLDIIRRYIAAFSEVNPPYYVYRHGGFLSQREGLVEALAQTTPRDWAAMREAIKGQNPEAQYGVIEAAGLIGSAANVLAVDIAEVVAATTTEKSREAAVKALGLICATSCPEAASSALLRGLKDESVWVRSSAAHSLGQIGQKGEDIATALAAALDDDIRVSTVAAASLLVLTDGASEVAKNTLSRYSMLRGQRYGQGRNIVVVSEDRKRLSFFEIPEGHRILEVSSYGDMQGSNPSGHGQISLCPDSAVHNATPNWKIEHMRTLPPGTQMSQCSQTTLPRLVKTREFKTPIRTNGPRGLSAETEYFQVSTEQRGEGENAAKAKLPVTDQFYGIIDVTGNELFKLDERSEPAKNYITAMGLGKNGKAALFGLGELFEYDNGCDGEIGPMRLRRLWIWRPGKSLQEVDTTVKSPAYDELAPEFFLSEAQFAFSPPNENMVEVSTVPVPPPAPPTYLDMIAQSPYPTRRVMPPEISGLSESSKFRPMCGRKAFPIVMQVLVDDVAAAEAKVDSVLKGTWTQALRPGCEIAAEWTQGKPPGAKTVRRSGWVRKDLYSKIEGTISGLGELQVLTRAGVIGTVDFDYFMQRGEARGRTQALTPSATDYAFWKSKWDEMDQPAEYYDITRSQELIHIVLVGR